MEFWLQPLLRIAGVAGAALFAGVVFAPDYGWAAAVTGLLILVVVQLVYLRRLQRWLADPDASPIPDGWGAWNSVFSTLYRARRREEASRRGLSSALERIQLAAGALPDGVVILDAGHHVEWCNAAAESHFGIDLARDRGLLFTHIARHPVIADYLALDVGAPPVTLRPTQNPARMLSLQMIPFGVADRLLLSRDVTAIERAETIRRDFVANVSHELRTPLTVLTGFLEMLDDETVQDPAAARRHIKLMREQAERMGRLVADLLTLSRLESDNVIAPATVVDVPDLLEALLDDARSLSAGRHRLHLDADESLAVTGNADEIRSAFLNLVSNAIRYTPSGGEITIGWSQDQGRPRFEVRDNGMGIAPEMLDIVFRMFAQADEALGRVHGGLGVGLTLARHVIDLHAGTIEARSGGIGRGSEFIVHLPRLRVDASMPFATSAQPTALT